MDSFDPSNVNLSAADPAQVICFLATSSDGYNGMLGARVSAVFVIFVVSTAVTFFPVVALRIPKLKIPLYVYLFARYFGTGVIIATAFIHLLDPSYAEIGPNTCVGMTGNWAQYSWPPAIALTSAMAVFLLDFGAELYVESKYGIDKPDTGNTILQQLTVDGVQVTESVTEKSPFDVTTMDADAAERSFQQQIAAFLILEFGVIFHSVIIGLNLGVVGSEFTTLYPVLVFHQSFEGLGIGVRMSTIPFKRGSWMPWLLCMAYGLTTPISIAIGLGLHTTYNPNSTTANIVAGVLDATSAGILIYTGLVELLARDFLFDPSRTKNRRRLAFMVICTLAGAGVMALIGKWA
jgi:solute carrier family 39 (zinc transporter), member 1/2/3